MAAMAAMAAMSYCFLDGGIEGRRGARAHVLLALGLSFLATDHAAPHSKKSTAWEGGEFWASCFSGPGTVSQVSPQFCCVSTVFVSCGLQHIAPICIALNLSMYHHVGC